MPEKEATSNLLDSTAYWTASVRARESQRSDRLFDDPWAAALAGKVGEEWGAGRTADSLIPITIRTRYFDDFLQGIIRQHSIKQIVLVAAGLDTRAFRLGWAQGTVIFELDQPEVIHYKEGVLRSLGAQAQCERKMVGMDLTKAWEEALVANGFSPKEQSCWLLEGFTFYTPSESIRKIIDQVTGLAAKGSWLGFDCINSLVLTSPFTKAWVDMQAQAGAPWIGSLDDPEDFLTGRGWKAHLTQGGQPDANYGRWVLPVLPTKMPNMPHNWLVTAEKE